MRVEENPDSGPDAPARIAVFEPNISPIKTCLPPMLIADGAARLAPEAVGSLALYNTKHLAGRPTFDFALSNLSLSGMGRVELFERDYFARAMQANTLVVSHQLECTQNYLYLDALHGGFPLVHNSPFFTEVGYYYPGDDLEEGARQVLRAWREHDSHLEEYRRRAAQALAATHPHTKANRDAYARRLIEATQPARRTS